MAAIGGLWCAENMMYNKHLAMAVAISAAIFAVDVVFLLFSREWDTNQYIVLSLLGLLGLAATYVFSGLATANSPE